MGKRTGEKRCVPFANQGTCEFFGFCVIFFVIYRFAVYVTVYITVFP